MYLTHPDRAAFERLGWQVIRGVFTPDEVADLRERCRQSAAQGLSPVFLLGNPHLSHLVGDERLVSVARALLGADPVAIGEDNLLRGGQVDFPTVFHKDNADRLNGNAPDWTQPYPIIRFGIYLQDYSHHSGGLALYEGSHRREVSAPDGRVDVHRGTMRFVENRVGDLAAWYFTTSHRGNALRFRSPLLNSLPKAVAVRLHRFPQLFWPIEPERWGIFLSYGLQGPALERHLRYLATRTYAVEGAQAGPFLPDAVAQTSQRLEVIDLPARLAHIPLSQAHKEHVELPF